MNRNFRNCLLFILLFVSLGLLTYGPSLNSEFLIDDQYYRNSDYRITFSSGTDFFTASDSQHYSPIYDLLNVSLFKTLGDNPFPYRLFNVILFALTCTALYFYLQRLGISKKASLLTSLLFLVHPLNAHCVNYITCNFVFVFGLLLMAAHSSFLSFKERREKKRRFLLMSYVFYGLSLLTFEGALLFPLYLANDLLIRKKEKLSQSLKLILPFILLAAVYLLLWKCIAGGNSQALNDLFFQLPQWLTLAPSVIYLIYWYIANLFWPQGIVLIYDMQPLPESPLGLTVALLSGLAVLFLFYFLRHNRMKLFSLVWFALGFILVIPAAFAHYDIGLIIEPHWFFFSSIGFFLFIALTLSQWIPYPKGSFLKRIVVISIFLGLFLATQNYNTMAKTEESYCRHWLSVSPNNTIALTQLGKVYLKQGRYDEALTYYQKSLLSKDDLKNAIAYRSMAMIYAKKERWEQAKSSLDRAIQLNPKDAHAFELLGIYFTKQNQLHKAEENFAKSLELNPHSLSANKNMSRLYELTGRKEKAIELYQNYLNLPGISSAEKIDTHILLAILYQKTQQTDESFAHISETIKLDPSGNGYFKLCEAVYAENFTRLAEDLLKNYMEYFRPSPQAYLLYGLLLGNQKQYQQAIEMWQKGRALNPSDQRFKQNIETAQRLMVDAPQ